MLNKNNTLFNNFIHKWGGQWTMWKSQIYKNRKLHMVTPVAEISIRD